MHYLSLSTDGRTDGRKDGRTDGRTDGITDGITDEQIRPSIIIDKSMTRRKQTVTMIKMNTEHRYQKEQIKIRIEGKKLSSQDYIKIQMNMSSM